MREDKRGEKNTKNDLHLPPFAEMKGIKKDLKELNTAFTAVAKSFIGKRKRKSYSNADELCRKTNLNMNLLRILQRYEGAKKSGGKIYITRTTLDTHIHRYKKLIFKLEKWDEIKNKQIERGKKEQEIFGAGLKKEREQRENLEAELKEEKEKRKKFEKGFQEEKEQRENFETGFGEEKEERKREQEERKRLEALLKKRMDVGGRPKTEVNKKDVAPLRSLGWSSRNIGNKLGVSHTTIAKIIKQIEDAERTNKTL